MSEDIEVNLDFFRQHVHAWSDFQLELDGYHNRLVSANLPQLPANKTQFAKVNEYIVKVNQAQARFKTYMQDASHEAGRIADALYLAARKYEETEAANAAESARLAAEIEGGK